MIHIRFTLYNSHQVDDFWMMDSFLRGALDEALQTVQNRTKQKKMKHWIRRLFLAIFQISYTLW